MTREEAITILECTMPNSSIRCGASDEEIEEAMMIAIEALEQEPKTHGYMLVCPNCGLDVHSDFESCPRCGARMKGGE